MKQFKNICKKQFSLLLAASLIFAAFSATQAVQSQEKIAGIWQGKLQISPDAGLRIVFHISKDDSGNLVATLDSPDQKATGIAVNEVKFENGELYLKINRIQGAYKGKVDLAKKMIDGTWSQGDGSMPLKLKKVDAAKMFKASEKKEIELSEQVLKKYTGKYELQPGVMISITLEGKKLMSQVTGQPKVQIFPESETKFFYKVVEAQIEFNLDKAGKVESLTLDQFGRKLPAKKLE
jgi:hypothetical protein